jgi:hypothetical protein
LINLSARRGPCPNQKLQQTKSLALAHLVIDGSSWAKKSIWYVWYDVWSGWRAVGWESAVSHQYKAGDVVTVFQISSAKELVIEGKHVRNLGRCGCSRRNRRQRFINGRHSLTIRKRVAEVDEHYRVEFANKPGMTYQRFVDSWGQDDPEKYVQDFNRRSAR